MIPVSGVLRIGVHSGVPLDRFPGTTGFPSFIRRLIHSKCFDYGFEKLRKAFSDLCKIRRSGGKAVFR